MATNEVTSTAPLALQECEVCGNQSGNSVHTATEMMFGLGGRFRYLECGQCGCLALQDVPGDLSPFYPPDYYSFADGDADPRVRFYGLRRRLMGRFLRSRRVAELMLRTKARLGSDAPPWVLAMSGLNLTTEAAILDVGSGSGHRLRHLERMGFTDLTGADAFLPTDGRQTDHVTLVSSAPSEVSGIFDFIMCHHSFEHMADPAGVLATLRDRLSPHGAILLRVPLAGSFAWRHYGVDWVQLDAPRHLFVFTRTGMDLLAAKSGLAVTRVIFDSDALQFWGSEQYKRGIPLSDPRTPGRDGVSLFTSAQIEDYERRARSLNADGDGDQVAFLLEKR